VSVLTGNDWQAEGGKAAEAVARGHRAPTWSETLTAVRDTLIVFGMQLVFRVTMFLRHLNY
jgi:hypothetical protein